MALATDTIKKLITALADKTAAQEMATAENTGILLAAASGYTVKTLIVATNVSTTIDFASLAVGDKVLILPAVAGNSMFVSCATAGTLPQAAVVGSLYVVLRAFTAATAVTTSY